ncbi:MAG TPA: biotin--[acetyl-CoA-carboxylase] ligase, partial [Verrucomicrobia bacterium]|nr:biotin--[acetyl-CoA-carboxylase] ligase [Verrucomicrobiota bacterium]
VLHADDLVSRLREKPVIGREIKVFKETTSTNDVVGRLARDGVPEGAVVFSESQTKGRGRLGRCWVSAPGKGLWFSVLLRPDMLPSEVTRLTIMVGAALVAGIQRETHLPVDIKWPNDICFEGRKIAGILTELNAELDHVNYVVLGIGINVNMVASDFPPELKHSATSLFLETGHFVPRADLATTILREIDVRYRQLNSNDFDQVADEWQHHCSTIGKEISVRMGDQMIQGRAESLDSDGALLLRGEHGQLERIIGGDVTLRASG